ncbi:integrin alpha FG-GAP repeat containing protein 1 [Nematocida homosporus]|uniref:integrin alpha FG-GAP repeat containing protein 1 n=1 Tax=Nematocida homosporus TaxID=1912981 RepID=UPI0022204E57|nr:integrin alpha FG-GAP repeat containing protein 1 [Nematocida homosporus]KAI5184918.1 integrin alpha FG-GAP repeat containing protein 1 [Nematocida homosporus]
MIREADRLFVVTKYYPLFICTIMWLWKKKEENIAFKVPEMVQDNFIALAYANTEGEREVDIVGTNGARNSIVILSKKLGGFVRETEMPVRSRVDFIIPVDMDNDGAAEFIVVTKEQSHYQMTLVNGEGIEQDMGKSDSMPFLVSHKSLIPAVLVQSGGKSYLIRGDKGVYRTEIPEKLGLLRPGHSSAFVDVNGDGIADLVLDTIDGSERVVEVWLNRETGFEFKERLVLPEAAGPFVLGDFSGRGSADILYLTNTAQGPAVNLLPNARPTYCSSNQQEDCLPATMIMKESEVFGYTQSSLATYYLGNEIPDSQFVLYNHQIPIFPAVLDLNKNTLPDLLVLVHNTQTNHRHPMVLMNRHGKGFHVQPTALQWNYTQQNSDNISFLAAARGVSDILLGTLDQSPQIFLAKNESDLFGYHLSISAIGENAKGKYSSPVIGTTYACKIVETGRVVTGFYPPQSGYAPMQTPVTTLGLGNTNVFVGAVHTRVPHTAYAPALAVDKIVPNSELMMQLRNGTIKHVLHLNITAYWAVAVPIILSLMMFFGVIAMYFIYKEKRKTVKNKAKTRYDINFSAL